MTHTILIVDDSLTVRMDLAQAFEASGVRAITSATATEARIAIKSDAVDAILLDVLLPDADGVDLLQEFRSDVRTSTTPILMLTSETEVADRVRGLETGADEYVGKPYDTSYVVAKTQELIRAGSLVTSTAQSVLIIDDSLTYQEQLRTACTADGYTAHVASSGEEGLRFAAALRPDVIVVDGVLPDIDGATVIRRLRLDAGLRNIPCLLLTASEDREAELRALDAGADAFVRKSEQVDVLLTKMHALLRRTSSSSSSDTSSLLGPKKILAVDDSLTFLHELSESLRNEGYDVIPARSGEEAIALLAVESVDCILLDLMMPEMNGKETCTHIKATPILRDVPLIMLTALEDGEAMIDAFGVGADDYISKSADFEVLHARIRAQLRRKQFEDQNRRYREQLLRKEIEATEARAAASLAETRAALVGALERKNKELEAFSYSVSHDLRAPLRSIDGFSQALLEDCNDSLDELGQDYLRRICAAAKRMGELIDDLLELSRVSRASLQSERVDLSAIAHEIVDDLKANDPERHVKVEIQSDLIVGGDARLVRAALENLIGNAWKFTSKVRDAIIEVGADHQGENSAYFVRDNGDGFDMKYADKLFSPFQRLHDDTFPGTGIGLATVYRIIDRHGGRVWADAEAGHGATFHFTLPSASETLNEAVAQ